MTFKVNITFYTSVHSLTVWHCSLCFEISVLNGFEETEATDGGTDGAHTHGVRQRGFDINRKSTSGVIVTFVCVGMCVCARVMC